MLLADAHEGGAQASIWLVADRLQPVMQHKGTAPYGLGVAKLCNELVQLAVVKAPGVDLRIERVRLLKRDEASRTRWAGGKLTGASGSRRA